MYEKRLAPNQDTPRKDVGTVYFTLRHAQRDWTTNSNSYDFGTLNRPPVNIKATKMPDRTLTIEIEGPFDSAFLFTVPTPPAVALRVAITWGNQRLNLFLNGEKVQTINKKES